MVCGTDVPHHPSSSRDHCNKCLYSLHVDISPGDRINPCGGLLEPVDIEMKNGGYRIRYLCALCNKKVVNVVAPDDDREKIITLTAFPA